MLLNRLDLESAGDQRGDGPRDRCGVGRWFSFLGIGIGIGIGNGRRLVALGQLWVG